MLALWYSLLNWVRLYYRQPAGFLQKSGVGWADVCKALHGLLVLYTCVALRRKGTTPSWLQKWTLGIRLARPGRAAGKFLSKSLRRDRG